MGEMFKFYLNETGGEKRSGFIWLITGPLAGCIGKADGPSGFAQRGEFLDWVLNCVFTKYCAQWIYFSVV
jgi:hypothetical protein